MLDLDLDTLVRVLISLGIADPTVGQIGQALRLKLALPGWTDEDHAALVTLLSEGERAGVLEVWTIPDYQSTVTLTPLSAGRHRLELYRPWDEDRLYWRHERDVQAPIESDGHDDEEEPVDLSLIVDSGAPTPFDILASTEAVETHLASLEFRDRDRTAIGMRHLAGIRDAWPIPAIRVPDIDAGRCGGCLDKPQRLNEVCLWCHRSGIDRYLPAVKAERARKKYRTGKLKGGVGA